MASISYVTPEEFATLLRRLDEVEARMQCYIDAVDEEIDTKTALKITGLKSPTTLILERCRPGTLL